MNYALRIFFAAAIAVFGLSLPVQAQPTFQEVFEKHNTVMLLIDPKTGMIVDANDSAAYFYNYTRDQLRQMRIQQINQLTAEQVAEERQLAKEQGRNFFIFRHKLGNDDIRTVEVHSVPHKFDGKVLLFSIIRDISEQRELQKDIWHYQSRLEDIVEQQTKTIEQKAQQTFYMMNAGLVILSIVILFLLYLLQKRRKDEKELRLASSVFETAREAVMVTDINNRIKMVNPAFTAITGYEFDEVRGADPAILKSGQHNDSFYDDMYRRLEDNGFWEGEIWNKRKSGETFPERLTISILHDNKGVKEGYVAIFSDITKRKQAEDHIQHQANYDNLTDLANRNLFMDHLSGAIYRAERDHNRVALLFLDLDRFKHINDTLGHSMGDELLKEAAQRLQALTRKSDTCARLGGDEFAILLPDIQDMRNVEEVVGKILEKISEPYDLDGNSAFVSASIGVTVYPEDGYSPQTLLRNADSAMYRAKDKGRNAFQFFTAEMDQEAQKRRELENALYVALENNEFVMNYQPIISGKSGKVMKCEALIRWSHPKKGIISPTDFIPLAEEVGLILPIGEWVLREACREAAIWHKTLKNPPSIAVNFSSRQFQRVNIPTLVQEVLDENQLPPEALTIEITENLLIQDDKTTLEQLNILSRMGISLAIDDFGTGYSSLSYLKKFPISVLKIDRSFIKDMQSDPEDAALVNAMISMAKSLNLKVVAEGAETAEQIKMLQERECEYIQGYYYSRPLPAADFNGYLNDRKQKD
ncbi:EAL domain-containing protein [Terasakiella sp. A23]|uniref:sensor domain-containing protein n=1 Tax=Terasakiella sp. FCG-A23 TaxID=3080561 RepID=UPI002955293A|nr:EAL domain-containing protein [Terasakiella sp. A23]MDV7338804.1 EAL domain-containing protein [Terasakiella sp. A23]